MKLLILGFALCLVPIPDVRCMSAFKQRPNFPNPFEEPAEENIEEQQEDMPEGISDYQRPFSPRQDEIPLYLSPRTNPFFNGLLSAPSFINRISTFAQNQIPFPYQNPMFNTRSQVGGPLLPLPPFIPQGLNSYLNMLPRPNPLANLFNDPREFIKQMVSQRTIESMKQIIKKLVKIIGQILQDYKKKIIEDTDSTENITPQIVEETENKTEEKENTNKSSPSNEQIMNEDTMSNEIPKETVTRSADLGPKEEINQLDVQETDSNSDNLESANNGDEQTIEQDKKPFSANYGNKEFGYPKPFPLPDGTIVSFAERAGNVVKGKQKTVGDETISDYYKNNILIGKKINGVDQIVPKKKIPKIAPKLPNCDGFTGHYKDRVDFNNGFQMIYNDDLNVFSEVKPENYAHLKIIDKETGDLYEEKYSLADSGKLLLQSINGQVMCRTQ